MTIGARRRATTTSSGSSPACARPSKIALQAGDCDVGQGKILVNKARARRRNKDRTKTGEARIIQLCPRALHVLKRQLALRARLKLTGMIGHDDLFLRESGQPIRNLNDPSTTAGAGR